MLAPHPNVPQSGAVAAEMGNLYSEQAQQQAAEREAWLHYYSQESGLPLQEQLSKVNEALATSKQKILGMQMKYDAQLAKPAMTALGRSLNNQATVKSQTPQSVVW